MALVSIIVPVYNVQRYLGRCIRSLTAQDYRDIEIILVNDASTDGSLDVCRRMARKDPRIRIIDKPVNEGVDRARFTGLDSVDPRSEYVMFVDSDDWTSRRLVSRCVTTARATEADCVIAGHRRVYDRLGLIGPEFRLKIGRKDRQHRCRVLTREDGLFDDYFVSFFGVNIIPVNLFARIYRRDLLQRAALTPTGLKWGEDMMMNMAIFPHIRRLAVVDEVLYYYRYGGMTSRYQPWLVPTSLKIFRMKEAAIERHDYRKATVTMHIEMKNVLKSDICYRIARRIASRDEDIEHIARLLLDPAWDRVALLAADDRYLSDPFVQALARRDAAALYDHCASFTRPYGLKRRLQEAVLRMIS